MVIFHFILNHIFFRSIKGRNYKLDRIYYTYSYISVQFLSLYYSIINWTITKYQKSIPIQSFIHRRGMIRKTTLYLNSFLRRFSIVSYKQGYSAKQDSLCACHIWILPPESMRCKQNIIVVVFRTVNWKGSCGYKYMCNGRL